MASKSRGLPVSLRILSIISGVRPLFICIQSNLALLANPDVLVFNIALIKNGEKPISIQD
jgi:hypothetical protein